MKQLALQTLLGQPCCACCARRCPPQDAATQEAAVSSREAALGAREDKVRAAEERAKATEAELAARGASLGDREKTLKVRTLWGASLGGL